MKTAKIQTCLDCLHCKVSAKSTEKRRVYMKVAEEAWKKLLRWISLCRIPEVIAVGKRVRNYFWGVLNAIRLGVTNGALEATNGCIQRIKRMAYGFRNKERFKTAILFHLGNLNMNPSTL